MKFFAIPGVFFGKSKVQNIWWKSQNFFLAKLFLTLDIYQFDHLNMVSLSHFLSESAWFTQNTPLNFGAKSEDFHF